LQTPDFPPISQRENRLRFEADLENLLNDEILSLRSHFRLWRLPPPPSTKTNLLKFATGSFKSKGSQKVTKPWKESPTASKGMSGKSSLTTSYIRRVLEQSTVEELEARLSSSTESLPERFPGGSRVTPEALNRRWKCLEASGAPQDVRDVLLDSATGRQADAYSASIENFIGTVKVPIGIAGPLRVNGLFAKGDYHVPLATTEAALVASYHRGACLLTAAGGCRSLLLYEALSRSPVFAFKNLISVGKFLLWATENLDHFRAETAKVTRHGKLLDMGISVEGNHVYLDFEFTTGDAAGQNMVTIATQSVCDYILKNTPITPVAHYVEGNFSGDKKASAQSFTTVRGKKLSAEVELSPKLVDKYLSTTPERMSDYWRISAIGGVLSGTIGVQGHFANGLTAVSIACGQDAACVAESAVGITRFEVTPNGSLYASVTLPNIVMGTVGGGTGLPSQNACLRLMGLSGTGHSQAFAEIVAALLLGGELSIIGALTAGHFTKAHEKLARQRTPDPDTTQP
jgi:hydroxymethylglutaryl-CoA reductase (NADPH)